MFNMSKATLLVGEPMGLFIAQTKGPLEDVEGYSLALAGAEFNVAIGMSRLGLPVSYYTRLGNDPFGKRVIKMMKSNNISTELIKFMDDRTTGFMLKSKVDKGDPEIFYYRKNSAASSLCITDIRELDFSPYDAIHVTGITPAISESAKEATEELINQARQNNTLFTFDPNLRPQLWKNRQTMVDYMNGVASQCDIFMPGINEAKTLLDTDIPEKIAETYIKSGTKAVTIKLGDKGAYYATNRESGYVESFYVDKVIDTVGAGDGFAAGVLSALKEGLSFKDAVTRGNAIGAIQVMSIGDNDGLPTRQELVDFMAGKKDWRIDHE